MADPHFLTKHLNEQLTIVVPSFALAMMTPLAGIADLGGDVPVALGRSLLLASTAWFFSLFTLHKWVTGRALTTGLIVATLLVVIGNLFEGIGEQAGLKVGSSAFLFLIVGLVLVNVHSRARWRTFQSGLLLLWSGLTAALVYLALSEMFDDVTTRLDESVAVTAAPGLALVAIATASHKSLMRPTRLLAAVGLVGIVASIPLLFIGEFWSVVAGSGFAIICSGFVYEALRRTTPATASLPHT